MKFNELMRTRPAQWGLRGDPYLWDEIRQYLKNVEVPANNNELVQILELAFEELVGQSIEGLDDILVERYCYGGMSSGKVSTSFWRDIAIPLLVEKHQDKKRENRHRNTCVDLTDMYAVVEDSIRVSKGYDSITIEVLTISWEGPHTPISDWVVYKELPLDCKLNIEIHTLLRSKYFGYCESCNSYSLEGHMYDKKMCQGCASHHLGVVY